MEARTDQLDELEAQVDKLKEEKTSLADQVSDLQNQLDQMEFERDLAAKEEAKNGGKVAPLKLQKLEREIQQLE